MDPDANLNEQLELAQAIADEDEDSDRIESAENGQRLADLVLALHEWISKGGFLPTAWRDVLVRDGWTPPPALPAPHVKKGG